MGGGVCEHSDVRKNLNSKFSQISLVMLFQFMLTIKLSIFYREKPLPLNAVVQTHYQGVNFPG